METLEDIFSGKTSETPEVEDTTVTQETVQEEVLDQQESTTQQIEHSEEVNQEIPQEESQEQGNDVDENSLDYWKGLAEKRDNELASLKKQHSDYQSFADKKYNELDKKLNMLFEQKPQQSQPQQAEQPKMSQEELNELFFENPVEAAKKMMELYGPQAQTQQPQFNPQEIQMQVQENVMRELHNDFDEVLSQVNRQVAYNPELLAKIQQSSNPAKTAYQEGTRLRQAEMIQKDPDAYEKELRAKWEEELKTKNNNSSPTLRTIPASSPTKSTGGKTAKNSNALDSIFGAGKKKAGGYA